MHASSMAHCVGCAGKQHMLSVENWHLKNYFKEEEKNENVQKLEVYK